MNSREAIQLHPLLRVALCMIMGIFVADEAEGLIPWTYWCGGVAVVLVATYFVRHPVGQGILLLISVFCLGGGLMATALSDIRQPLPEGEQTCEVVVMNRPTVHGKVLMCDLLVANGSLAGRRLRASFLRDTIESRYLSIQECGGLLVRARLEPNQNYKSGNFNYVRWLETHGFAGRAFVYIGNWKHRQVSLRQVSWVERLRISAMKVRRRLTEKYQQLGLADEEYAVVAAMSLGDKTALNPSTRGVFQQTGAAHVLALSGLHLGVMYFFLLLFFTLRRYRMLSQVLLVTAIWGFTFLTGLSMSLLRAATMLTIYALANIMGRGRVSLNTLALTVVILLLANPLSLYDVGFQLSVMAVLGLTVYSEPIYHLFRQDILRKNRTIDWVWSMVSVSIAAQLGVAPLVMYYFGQFPTYFILTNLVAIPLTTFILPVCFLLLVFSSVPVVSDWLASVVAWLTRLLLQALESLSSFPFASIEGLYINMPQVICCYALIACGTGIVYYLLKIRRVRAHLSGVPLDN